MIIYLIGFVIVFIFTLYEEVVKDERLNIKGEVMDIDWESTLAVCFVLSLFWVAHLFFILLAIIHEVRHGK